MRAFIQDLDSIAPIVVEPTHTVAALKEKIKMVHGIDPAAQKLVFADQELHEDQTLQELNVVHTSTLLL
eukprot:1358690-Karenia_brevis.AAC.1